jgi:hypothetical protein
LIGQDIEDTFVDTFDGRGKEESFNEVHQHSNAVSQHIPKGTLIDLVEGNHKQGQFSKMLEGNNQEQIIYNN